MRIYSITFFYRISCNSVNQFSTGNRILDKVYHWDMQTLWYCIPFLFHQCFSKLFPRNRRVQSKWPETVLFSAMRTPDWSALRRLQVLKFHCPQETNVIVWCGCSFHFLEVHCILYYVGVIVKPSHWSETVFQDI